MQNIWTIARREYKLYYVSPIAYVLIFILLVILGLLFFINYQMSSSQASAPSLQIIIWWMTFLFIFITPAITMRTLAEEQRNGTLELLLTAPVNDWELVVGKWLGTFLFTLTILLLTWIYPIILNQLVQPGIDQSTLVANYLGLALLFGAYMAIGVATSSFFTNQIAAFFACLGLLLIFQWIISFVSQSMGASPAGSLISYLSLGDHFYNTFYQGIIDLKDITYYLSVTAFSLLLGTVSIETRRWR